MIKIRFSKDMYYLPATWDEMKTRDIITLSRLVMADKGRHSILFKLALSIMGLSMAYRYKVNLSLEPSRLVPLRYDSDRDDPHYFIRRGLRKFYLVSATQMAVVTSSLSFIFDGDTIAPRLIKNPLQDLRIGLKKYHGPGDGLTNLTLGEFIQAEIERAAFEAGKKDDHENRFFAVLWRPPAADHPDGDNRAPLCQDDIPNRARRMAKLNPHVRQVMSWFYLGCLNFMYNKFDLVFSSGSDGDQVSAFDNFMNMVNLLSAGDLSKFGKVREAPLYDALYNLQEIMENNEKKKT